MAYGAERNFGWAVDGPLIVNAGRGGADAQLLVKLFYGRQPHGVIEYPAALDQHPRNRLHSDADLSAGGGSLEHLGHVDQFENTIIMELSLLALSGFMQAL